MTEHPDDEAVISLDAAGRYVDADASALEMLGLTLPELLASPPDRFRIESGDEDDRAALRSEWEAGGSRSMVGTAGLRRADGSTIRVSYAIEKVDTGFRARLSPTRGSPAEPATVLTVGEVLREWRAAERDLAELVPGTPDWARMQGMIELLRARYQEVFRSLTSSGRSGSSA